MSKYTNRRSGALIGLAVVAAVALVGCGDPDRPADATGISDTRQDEAVDVVAPAGALVREAAQRSAEAPTVQIWVRITRNGKVLTETTSHSTADGSASTGTMTMPGAMGEIATLSTPEAFYFQFPNLPDGKEWVRMGRDEMTDMMGIDPGAAQQDPHAAFSILEGVSDDVAVVGSEDVNGVATTRYTFTVSMDALMAQAVESGVLTDQAAAATSVFEDKTEMNVWIDDDGLVRRTRYQLNQASDGDQTLANQVGMIGYEMEFSNYGEPVEVTAPAPEVTMSLADMLAGS